MRALLLAVMPMILSAADLTVDHVTVAGKDLKSMQARLASVGIHAEYGGAHSNHATEMALASFPDGSYLELIAIQADADPKAVAAHYWSPEMQGNAGPAAWAVRANELGPEVARLKKAGIVVTEPARGGRQRDPTGSVWNGSPRMSARNRMARSSRFLIQRFHSPRAESISRRRPATRDFTGVSRIV